MYFEQLSVPEYASCDVLVVGGGIAGIAAALAAAREGRSVILLERNYMLGGLGTAGLITGYLPICDGLGHQVSFGIAEELLRLADRFNATRPRAHNWLDSDDPSKRTANDRRFEAWYNPNYFAIAAEQLLHNTGVNILYGVYAVSVVKENGRIAAVITESKSGRTAITVKSVVDASGDADIAHFADVPCETFKQGNILAAWYYASDNEHPYQLMPLGYCDIPDEQKTKDNEVKTLIPRRFLGLDAQEIADFVRLSHESTMNDVMKHRQNGHEDYVPATIATMPQLRMTRKIVGEYELSDKEDHKFFADSVGMVSDWRKRGPAYEVPFRTLFSAACPNLITAGRCTSVTEPMWDIMRVIPCCSVTGQAAGTAAAMTDDFAALDVAALQEKLVGAGVKLHISDVM